MCELAPAYLPDAICYHSPLFSMDRQYRHACSIQNVPYSVTVLGFCMGCSPMTVLSSVCFISLGVTYRAFPIRLCLGQCLLPPLPLYLLAFILFCIIVGLQLRLPIWTISSFRGVPVFAFMPSPSLNLCCHVECTKGI